MCMIKLNKKIILYIIKGILGKYRIAIGRSNEYVNIGKNKENFTECSANSLPPFLL